MRKTTAFFVLIFIFLNFQPNFSYGQTQKPVITDKANLTPTVVEQVIKPKRVEEIVEAVKNNPGPISIGGARYSQGGQIVTEKATFIDMRDFNKVINFSPKEKLVTVQPGITWIKLLDYIDPHNLSPKIMQTYSDFTVGGSLSVNAHGREPEGAIISSVKSIKVVLGNGDIVSASREENPEIFYSAIGGYGGVGVIVEATLELTDNIKIERRSKIMDAKQYPAYFEKYIKNNSSVVLHNAYLYAPEYKEVRAVTWVKTNKPLTITDHLQSLDPADHAKKRAAIETQEGGLGQRLRQDIFDPIDYKQNVVAWRNYEAAHVIAELPVSDEEKTYILQEYFVPVNKLNEFIPKLRKILQQNKVQILNLSIRHAEPDNESILSWSPKETFSIVLYYRQENTDKARKEAASWTPKLIDASISVGGTYYLPYQLYASEKQFNKSYPHFDEFVDLKKELDPHNKFRNKLWDKYYPEKPTPVVYYVGPRDTGGGPIVLEKIRELSNQNKIQGYFNYYDECIEKNGELNCVLPGSRQLKPLNNLNDKEKEFYIFVDGKIKSLEELSKLGIDISQNKKDPR